MTTRLNLTWKSPGPNASRYMASNKPVQILNGPIGSGKTTTVLMKAIHIAARQMVSKTTTATDGRPVRKFKLCVVRDTYRQLWKTTLPSWWKRVPKTLGEFLGSENQPASHRVLFELNDGTVVDFQADFLAIGENAVEDVLRGYEPTAFYLNEADLLAKEVYMYAKGRAGRFPDMSEGGPSWYGILMDCNAPVLTSWLYLEMFRATPEDVDLFRQPSGLAPDAENRENLPPGYYANQIKGQPEWYIKRMVENVPGFSRHGKSIYPEFVDTFHVARHKLEYEPRLKLILGLDAGLSPACAFEQRMPSGQLRILDELVSEQGTGPLRFGRMLAQRLADRYPNAREIHAWADPSAAYGADKKDGELDWIEIVAQEAGIQIMAAPTNATIPRREALRRPMTTMIDGGPGLLICPENCPIIREAFNSGYHFKKLPGADVERYSEEVEKNAHSHIAEAAEYGASAAGEDLAIRGRHAEQYNQVRNQTPTTDWDPYALPS